MKINYAKGLAALTAFYIGAEALFFASPAKGQDLSLVFDQAVKTEIPAYQIQKEYEHIAFECKFGDFPIDKTYKTLVAGRKPAKIDLLYSDFPKNMDFEYLNKRRLCQLEEVFPEWFAQNSRIQWEIVKQTSCSNQIEAEKLFHGFAIYFELPKKLVPVSYAEIGLNPHKFLPDSIYRQIKSIKPGSSKILERIKQGKMGSDSSAYNFFHRNAGKFKEIVVVSDWTSSMYDFTAQLLIYQEKMAKKEKKLVKAYMLFNDGGDMPTEQKELGKTGGIYTIGSSSLDEVAQFMEYVKSTGAGGDLPENDIEALLKAMEQFPESEEYFLIADNNSTVRDFSLHHKITKPIRIILGRVDKKSKIINPQYIKLAGKTGGSIHTADSDYFTRDELQKLLKDNQDRIAHFSKFYPESASEK